MYFLDNQSNEPNSLSFITANDESGFLHLYLYKISLEPHSLREHMNGKDLFINKRYLLHKIF